MQCFINLNKFNNILATATILATISCLVPKSAQAISLRFSGSPNIGETFVSFIVDTSIEQQFNPDLGVEYFPGAVQEVRFLKCKKNLQFLYNGCEFDEFLFGSGDLTFSQFYDFNNNEVPYYEAILSDGNSNSLKLGIYVPEFSNPDFNPELITSLSFLETQEPRIAARLNSSDPFTSASFLPALEVTAVPEPNGANSILGVGAIGAVLVFKRIKRSRKIQGNQNSTVENQDLAKP